MNIKKNRDARILCLLMIFMLLLVILVALLLKYNSLLYFSVQYPTQTTSVQKNNYYTRTFTAGYMDFKIDVPAFLNIDESWTSVNLKSPNGTILIGRVGTNFDTIGEYVNDLAEKNHFNILEKTTLNIAQYSAIKLRLETSSEAINQEEPVYFIYADGWVYTFETRSPNLFNDLEKIVSSFQYLP